MRAALAFTALLLAGCLGPATTGLSPGDAEQPGPPRAGCTLQVAGEELRPDPASTEAAALWQAYGIHQATARSDEHADLWVGGNLATWREDRYSRSPQQVAVDLATGCFAAFPFDVFLGGWQAFPSAGGILLVRTTVLVEPTPTTEGRVTLDAWWWEPFANRTTPVALPEGASAVHAFDGDWLLADVKHQVLAVRRLGGPPVTLGAGDAWSVQGGRVARLLGGEVAWRSLPQGSWANVGTLDGTAPRLDVFGTRLAGQSRIDGGSTLTVWDLAGGVSLQVRSDRPISGSAFAGDTSYLHGWSEAGSPDRFLQARSLATGSTWQVEYGHWRDAEPRLVFFGATTDGERLLFEGLSDGGRTMMWCWLPWASASPGEGRCPTP